MDLFRFETGRTDFLMRRGEFVEGLDTKVWVERYRDPGEVTLTGRLSSGIREKLPIGCFVSHVDSDEIMVIENHSISNGEEPDPVVIASGRSLETMFQHRIVGANRAWPSSGALPFGQYNLPPGPSWVQADNMLRQHVTLTAVNDNDAFPNCQILRTASGISQEESRIIARGDVHTRLLELLAVDDCGIRTIRPRVGSMAYNDTHTAFLIYKGVDRSKTVVFDQADSEVTRGSYLWSDKRLKNAALVTGKWVETIVNLNSSSGPNRRIMHVDGADIDQDQPEMPTGLAYSLIVAALRARGREALAKQKNVALSDVEIVQTASSPRYRSDYGLGDLVSIYGKFEESTVKQVIEHVEVDDEEGSRSYPTLQDPPEDEEV